MGINIVDNIIKGIATGLLTTSVATTALYAHTIQSKRDDKNISILDENTITYHEINSEITNIIDDLKKYIPIIDKTKLSDTDKKELLNISQKTQKMINNLEILEDKKALEIIARLYTLKSILSYIAFDYDIDYSIPDDYVAEGLKLREVHNKAIKDADIAFDKLDLSSLDG